MTDSTSPSVARPAASSTSGTRSATQNQLSIGLRSVGIVAVVAVLIWHGHETVSRLPSGMSERLPLPFTINDHPLHYYYSQITAEFFAGRRAFWGYDPNFMAGYAKTMIFPTGCTMPELVAVIFGRGSPAAFRWWVASTMFLPPFFLGLAARTAAGSWSAFAISFCLSVAWVWCGWPFSYVTWGMAPFIFGVAASVLAAVTLARWLDEPSWGRLIGGGLLAVVSTIAHPCSPVILVLILAPAYALRARALSGRDHCLAWCVPVVALVCWSPWWLPALRLRETFGSTETGFVNENIRGRLKELAVAQFPEETALLVAGLGAVPALWGIGRARMCVIVVGAVEFFVFTYFGSASEWIWKLQPGRYTQPLYATLIVLVGAGWARMTARLAERPRGRGEWLRFAVLAVTSSVGLCLVSPKVAGYLSSGRRPPMPSKLTPAVAQMIEFLRGHVDSSGRVLFEDRGVLDLGPLDPFEGSNPSALLPLLAPAQYIGGPYLKTHLKANFTQCGDGKIFGRDLAEQPIDVATIQRYAELYNIRWAVLRFSPFTEHELREKERELRERGVQVPKNFAVYWSAPLARLADNNPDVFRPLAQFGLIRVYELNREPNWAVVGRASVEAAPDRLDVTSAQADASGRLVLSYHWISTLRSTVPLRPISLADDPVPFIEVENPPDRFVIENRLW